MTKFFIFVMIVGLVICPVLFLTSPASSQEGGDPALLEQEEEFPPEELQDEYPPYGGEYGMPPPEEDYDEFSDEPVSAPSAPIAIEVSDEAFEEIEETGDNLISLDLKGIDIIEVFRILSMKIGKTVVAGKGVSGRVNLFLNNVTFEDALEVILITQGLACEQKGNIIMVMRDTEYKKRYGKDYDEKREFRSYKLEYGKPFAVFDVLSKLRSDIGKIIVDEGSGNIMLIDIPEKLDVMEKVMKDMDQSLTTQTFDLGYANADEMRDHLSNMITEGPGKMFVDERTNKVIISDLDEKVKDIEHMMEVFDEESRQVFIEAMILQIALKKEFQRGIDWEYLFTEGSGPFSLLDGLDATSTFPASPSFSPSPTLTAANTTMTIGTMAADNYTIALNFLETFGDTKVLSRPKIAAINNQEASILIGSREAYVTQSLSQGETTTVTSEAVSFIDVGVKLNVIPTMNRDGFITLQIKPEVSTVRETLSTSLGSNIPIVETSEASTTIKVKDGTTVLIGGLMKEEQRDDISGLPFLNRLPVVGTFFSSRATLNKKTELIIFLRPSIMRGDTDDLLKEEDPGRLISPEIWPEDFKMEFIKSELEKIGSNNSEDALDKSIFPQSPGQSTTAPENAVIQEKMKGIKDY